MSYKHLRVSGPIGNAPPAPKGSSFDKPNTANTTAREHAAHQSGTNNLNKETSAFKSPGSLGAQGHGGA